MDDLKEKKKTHTSGNEVAAKKMVVVNGTAAGNNWEGEMAKIKVKRVSWALHESLGGMGCMSIFLLFIFSQHIVLASQQTNKT